MRKIIFILLISVSSINPLCTKGNEEQSMNNDSLNLKDSILFFSNFNDSGYTDNSIDEDIPFHKRLSITIYGGYHYIDLRRIIEPFMNREKYPKGLIYGIGVDIRLGSSYNWSLEVSRTQYPNVIGETLHGRGVIYEYSLVLNYYFFEKKSIIRPNFHFGCGGIFPMPLINWDIGFGMDLKLIDGFYLKLSSSLILDGFGLLLDISYPSYLSVGLKYNFKNL